MNSIDHTATVPESVALLADKLYTTYCAAVGGFAFNGDPLPAWKEFFADPSKKKQSDAWLAVAKESLRDTVKALRGQYSKMVGGLDGTKRGLACDIVDADPDIIKYDFDIRRFLSGCAEKDALGAIATGLESVVAGDAATVEATETERLRQGLLGSIKKHQEHVATHGVPPESTKQATIKGFFETAGGDGYPWQDAKHPLLQKIHQLGWKVDIERKAFMMQGCVYRTSMDRSPDFRLDIDESEDPVTKILTRLLDYVEVSAGVGGDIHCSPSPLTELFAEVKKAVDQVEPAAQS